MDFRLELNCIADAVFIHKTQTLEDGGNNDPTFISLKAKGLLEPVGQPTLDQLAGNLYWPHMIPIRVWQYLRQNQTWLIDQVIRKNGGVMPMRYSLLAIDPNQR